MDGSNTLVSTKERYEAILCHTRTPDGGHRVVRVGIAAPVGVQVHSATVQVAVHDHHVLPRLVVVLGGASLYISSFQYTKVRRIRPLNFMRNPFLQKRPISGLNAECLLIPPYAPVIREQRDSDSILGNKRFR